MRKLATSSISILPSAWGCPVRQAGGCPRGKKTKTGYSTNAEILEKLRYDHPAVELVLHYRTLTKLKSTYCEGMLKVIGPDGRIHSNF